MQNSLYPQYSIRVSAERSWMLKFNICMLKYDKEECRIPPMSQVLQEPEVSAEDNRSRESHFPVVDLLKYRNSWSVSAKSHTEVGFQH